MPSHDTQADMYQLAVDRLQSAGLSRYEVANFARSVEAESSHNKNYWKAGQYIGVGPGAHSRVLSKTEEVENWLDFADDTLIDTCLREERVNMPNITQWLSLVNNKGSGISKRVPQNKVNILGEYIMVGLRTARGIESNTWNIFEPRMNIQEVFSNENTYNFMLQELLFINETGMQATAKGINVVESMVPDLLNVLKSSYI